MLIIVDNKIPEEAKIKLKKYGELLELETSGITYEAISGHPDIFFHQAPSHLFVAPNLPEKFRKVLVNAGIDFITGEEDVGEKYPDTAAYNAVSTNNLLIHRFRGTDGMITRLLDDADLIHVDQGYTRCNLLALGDNHFITSDAGIKRVLERFDKDCLYVSPDGITLEGFKHGFFGGCCGIYDRKVFVLGSLAKYNAGNAVRDYTEKCGCEVVELFNGQLFDGGSIIFVEGS